MHRCSTAGSTIPSTKTADVRRWLGEEADTRTITTHPTMHGMTTITTITATMRA